MTFIIKTKNLSLSKDKFCTFFCLTEKEGEFVKLLAERLLKYFDEVA